MDKKISFECPYCSTYMEAPKDALGRKVQCYKCEEKFELTLLHKVEPKPVKEETGQKELQAGCPRSREFKVSSGKDSQTRKKKEKTDLLASGYGFTSRGCWLLYHRKSGNMLKVFKILRL